MSAGASSKSWGSMLAGVTRLTWTLSPPICSVSQAIGWNEAETCRAPLSEVAECVGEEFEGFSELSAEFEQAVRASAAAAPRAESLNTFFMIMIINLGENGCQIV